MAIIVVGGAYKGAGKTSLICGIIAAFPRLRWTAVKITSDIHHLGAAERLSGTSPLSIWEQTAAGQGTDTARYLAARAHRGIFVTAPESDIPIAEIQGAIGSDSGTANVIFESNRIIRALKPDLCVAIIGDAQRAAKPSFQAFAEHADAFVTTDVASEIADGGNPLAPIFYLDSLERISGEMFAWMQARLRLTQTS